MSFTPLLRQAALARRTALAAPAFGVMRVGVRGVSGSAPKKAAAAHHGDHHDAHGDHHHAEVDYPPDVYTHESMFKQGWRPFWAILACTILVWPLLPSPVSGSYSPSLDPENVAAGLNDKNLPFLTRFLLRRTPTGESTKETADGFLKDVIQSAKNWELTSEAEIPTMRRMRYPSSFEQASPNLIPVGSQVDLSDLKVRSER